MLIIFLGSLAFALAAPPEIKLEPGTVLSYRGSFVPAGEMPAADARKSFDLLIGITQRDGKGARGFWLIDERGRGAWPWVQRFGAVSFDEQWHATGRGPALLYDRGEAKSVVSIAIPMLQLGQAPRAGSSWRDGRLDYVVEKSTQRADRDAWQIAVRDPFGPKRTLWRDAKLPLLLAATERVIIGRGEEHKLEYELTSVEMLTGDVGQRLSDATTALTDLQTRLNIAPEQDEIHFSADQVKLLDQDLPKIAALADGTALAKLVTSAQADLRVQSGRSTAVNELVKEAVGKKVQKFSATTTDGEELSDKQLAGNVTVLHFWEYRDEPLKEPYGQVGYLDFLYHQRGRDGLKVYGVAVDGRLADEVTVPAARRSVKKLKEFMNLSYPVLLDRGELLKQFGDPRVIGATLPLFVVIGRDGAVAHFHVGTYEVTREQGLKELNEAVGKAMKAK